MTHQTLRVFVVLLGMILFASCAPAPSPVPTSIPPTLAPRATQPPPTAAGPGYKLITSALRKRGVEGGWAYYSVELLLENTSNQFLVNPIPKTEKGVVKTSEGVTYEGILCPFEPSGFSPCPDDTYVARWVANKGGFVIPPNFRVRGGPDIEYRINFKAAEAAHPISVEIPSMGSIDLRNLPLTEGTNQTGIESKLTKPVIDAAATASFTKVGQTIQVRGAYAVTVNPMRQKNPGQYCYSYDVPIAVKNLSALNDTQVNLNTEVIMAEGWVVGNYGLVSKTLGPNQTADVSTYTCHTPAYIVFWGDTQAVVTLR